MANTMYHLIHANIAKVRAPLDDPLMADFVKHVDEIDALARSSPGFVDQPTPRVEYLTIQGPTPFAFTFDKRFTVDEMLVYRLE